MTTAITTTHLAEVCKTGHGAETCSFLFVDGNGIQCAKHTPLEMTIWVRRDSMTAQGDNCEGWMSHPHGTVQDELTEKEGQR